ncbi:MAG: hypothetical protein KGH64_01670 [Candidatus Micrarchaeota archaeon]|nr:hypothetical protein [Candidatus Micrarchaeota archaeon]MDE1834025.1 hypothetical protein [Candidatus Micrarchaeota archaeon]
MKNIANVLRYLLIIYSIGAMFALTVGASTAGTAVSTQLRNVCTDIRGFVGVLVVVLLALGAILYALSHVLPAAGNIKGNLQGWSLNMVVGAIVALVIYFLAPWIAAQIFTAGGGAGSSASIIGC